MRRRPRLRLLVGGAGLSTSTRRRPALRVLDGGDGGRQARGTPLVPRWNCGAKEASRPSRRASPAGNFRQASP
jgi:hypothetical protein